MQLSLHLAQVAWRFAEAATPGRPRHFQEPFPSVLNCDLPGNAGLHPSEPSLVPDELRVNGLGWVRARKPANPFLEFESVLHHLVDERVVNTTCQRLTSGTLAPDHNVATCVMRFEVVRIARDEREHPAGHKWPQARVW